jgi:hypothetical protein
MKPAYMTTRLQQELRAICDLPHVGYISNFKRDEIEALLARRQQRNVCGDSWVYYAAACRRLWLAFYDKHSFIPITIRERGSAPFVIVKPVGEDVVTKVAVLAKQLLRISGAKVIVKNISAAQRTELSLHGLTDYRRGDGWNALSRYDDQTYPEVSVTLRDVVALVGDTYAHLRHDLSRGVIDRISLEPYSSAVHAEEALGLVRRWRASFLARYPNESADELMTFYSVFFRDHERLRFRRDYIAWLCRVRDQVVGFVYGVAKNGGIVDMYANPCAAEENCTSEAVLFSVLRKLWELGFTIANLGGSETAGLHEFKLKFGPSQTIHRHHAILYEHPN